MRQGFLKGSFHLFGGRLRNNPRGHVVEMFRKVLGVSMALTFEGALHDLGKVALGRHLSGTRLRLQRGGIFLGEINCQVHGFLLHVNPAARVR